MTGGNLPATVPGQQLPELFIARELPAAIWGSGRVPRTVSAALSPNLNGQPLAEWKY
jgi:hypothetical protein